MYEAPIEKRVQVLDLDANFQLPLPSAIDSDFSQDYTAKFNGVSVIVKISTSGVEDIDDPDYQTILAINHSSGAGAMIDIYVGKLEMENSYYATTNVRNVDSLKEYTKATTLKGAGTKLWIFAMKVIQRYADTLGGVVNHRVNRISLYMDSKKWDKTFLPLLDKYGYQKIEEGSWEKTYTPEQK